MDSDRRQHLLRQRTVTRGMLTRIQHFYEAGEHKINEIQVRFNKLSDVFNRYDTAQSELELSDDTDHSGDRELFENQYYEVKAKFIELLHPGDNPGQSDNDSEHGSNHLSGVNHANKSYVKLPSIQLPSYDGTISTWLHFRDTFDSLIIQNNTLSNVKKFRYLISSLKGKAKHVISNLQITNDDFVVAWDLVTRMGANLTTCF